MLLVKIPSLAAPTKENLTISNTFTLLFNPLKTVLEIYPKLYL
jgi:hypothetical protein